MSENNKRNAKQAYEHKQRTKLQRQEEELSNLKKAIANAKKEREGKGKEKKGAGDVQKKPVRAMQLMRANELASKQKDAKYKQAVERTIQEGDVRVTSSPFSPSNNVVMATSNTTIPIRIPLNTGALVALAASIVSFAETRGWSANVTDGSYILGAIGFLANAFLNAALGITPGTGNVPKWFNIYVALLSPKKVRNGNTFYYYSWHTDATPGSLSPSSLIPVGPAGNSVNINYGVVDANDAPTNGLYYQVNQANYNAQIGAAAISSLYQFLSENTSKEMSYLHKMEPYGTTNQFNSDASAFANFVAAPGGGAFSSGAYGKRIGSETAVKTPISSVFTSAVQSFSNTERAALCNEFSSGDAFLFGGLVSLLTEKQIRKVRQPIYKMYDFLEFAHTTALMVTKAIQHFIDDPQTKLNLLVDGGDWTEIGAAVLPNMTLQDFTLLFRNEMMNAFSGTQCFAQTIYPKTVAQGNTGLTGLVCGVGTAPTATNPMVLPIYICEMIKSAVGRFVNNRTQGQDGKYFNEYKMMIPVLCQFFGHTLTDSHYQVTIEVNNSTAQYPVFTPVTNSNGNSKKPIPGSPIMTKPSKVGLSEEAISSIDGSTSQSTFLAINDPAALNKLVNSWNECMTALGAYIQRPGTRGQDGGPNGLTTVASTRYCNFVGAGKGKGKKEPIRVGRPKAVSAGYGDNQQIIVCSYQTPPIATVEQFIAMIKPKIFINDSTYPTSKVYLNMASINHESYSVPIAETPGVTTIADLLDTIATLCVNARDAGDNVITQALLAANEAGQGGIFSDIVDTFTNIGTDFVRAGASGAVRGLMMTG